MEHENINKVCESPIKWSNNISYILGFTYADGYIVRTDNNKNNIPYYRLGWHLAQKDKCLLDSFKQILNIDNDIKLLKDGSIDLMTTNQSIAIWMLEKGVLLNKTKRLSLPDMPTEYEADFIRGYFDGDGTVYLRKQNNGEWLSINIVGATKTFLQEIGNILKNRVSIIPKIRNKGTYWVLEYNNMESIALYRWMYKENTICLDRKYQVFVKWLNDKGTLDYGNRTCQICNQKFTVLADRSKICKKCKPLAREYYNKNSRSFDWKKIQSNLISNNKDLNI